MRSIRFAISLITVMTTLTSARAAENLLPPVLFESPICAHDKLGTVAIEAGDRVYENTTDVTSVDYRRAFARLAAAAQAQGANAVVIRWHKATYFTRRSARSPSPVHVQLRGAAIRIHGDFARCHAALVDPAEFQRRARRGEPINISSAEAYSD